MNTHPYERHLHRSLGEAEPNREPAESELSALAKHTDPSIRPASSTATPEPASSVAWVRPSDLPTAVGSKFIRRGIDLQAELNRRAQRAPRSAARVTRRAIARPLPSTPTTDRGVSYERHPPVRRPRAPPPAPRRRSLRRRPPMGAPP